MVLRLYDTLTRTMKEVDSEDRVVRMYVCGLTPQSAVHVGHIRTFVVFDVVRRLLESEGFKTIHVQNFTDIDDKIIAKASQMGINPSELAEKNIQEYYELVDKIHLLRAHHYPRVTDHIQEIVEAVAKLVEKGYAYAVDGDVYFDVRSFPDYGKLSHQTLEQLQAGARVEPSEKKRHPEDFALWKGAKQGEPSWSSPWGKGRPGWHIECSVMSIKYLGETIDLHGGGQDLIFPHHENEIAQSEALTGKKFSRQWMHVGWVTMSGAKMSKSTGNVILVADLLRKVNPDTLKVALLQTHYRSPLEADDSAISQADAFVERLRKTYAKLQSLSSSKGYPSTVATSEDSDYEKEDGGKSRASNVRIGSSQARVVGRLYREFVTALENDLDTPLALSKLAEMVRAANRMLDLEGNYADEAETMVRLIGSACSLLGLTLGDAQPAKDNLVDKIMMLLLEIRETARLRGDYELSDRIRLRLAEMNILIEDTQRGPVWFYKDKPSA
ncbi:MAG: cysteine--tRNA ligase [Candidatus Marsarchaeota archaeon]|nr:cysteine--tRNA ligase [Candidatus Marsarchaeota archaeon]